MENKHVTIRRSVFISLIIVLVILLTAFIYFYSQKTNDFSVKVDNQFGGNDTKAELQNSTINVVDDQLDEIENDLNNIDVDINI